MPSSFPPDDFRARDRQLMRVSQIFSPLQVASHEDGRSSEHSLPCAILAGEGGDRGFALFYEWSGLWSVGVQQAASPRSEVSWPWMLRLTAGVWGLSLDLRPGEELPLPRLLIAGFDGDLDAGCNALRRHVARHVAPALGGEPVPPPVSFNSWFAFGNDFTARSLAPEVDACARAGVEYFVVDGGWVHGDFRCGNGNWRRPDAAKFADGLPAFVRHVGERGMQMGLWFEPEYAHVDSEAVRDHPEWFLSGPRRSPWAKAGDLWEGGPAVVDVLDYPDRFKLLDLGQAGARQWCLDLIVSAYERWGVRWIRWDFNQAPRPYWEAGEAAGRIGLRQIAHITGLYELFDEIMRACPNLFIEQCAAGGGRIDLGTVRRGHAFWMNDHTNHTDIVRALQHGLNAVLPGIYANTNLCQGRFDYDDYDYLSHGAGSFGFSGRLSEAPRADFERYRAAVERFKGYRHLLGGDYARATGEPDARFGHAHVAWSDGSQTLEMEFNAGGVPRAATVEMHGG
jgi:alpha-galactosidase